MDLNDTLQETGTERLSPLDLAIEHVGGVSKLAVLLGVRHNTVSMWRKRRSVPEDQCRAVEEATGGVVTRYQLRPKTFGPAPAEAAGAASGAGASTQAPRPQ